MTAWTSPTEVPLVSIGIPTYQRAATLERALASARGQTYRRLEIVISDNASTDGTAGICRAAAAQDDRIRYVRATDNVGPTANFNRLFDACSGDYVMMLADDDWLDSDYVARCVAALRERPSATVVAGWAQYERAGAFVHDGVAHDHPQSDPRARVIDYLSTVADNGVFYGVMPRAALAAAAPMPNVLGNDWLHVARLTVQGTVHVLPGVRIHRELDGTSVDIGEILSTFGEAAWQARVPQFVIAWQLLRDIGWRHPLYARLGRCGRLSTGVVAALASIRWSAVAWHLATPTFARLARRPRGRVVYRAYDRITRWLGAGQAR